VSSQAIDAVSFVSGRTRLYGIVGDPIEQVRSPEMVTAEMQRRGADAVLVPIHVAPDDFDECLPWLMKVRNLDGLIFTIPYKARACGLANELGRQAQMVGAINALGRGADGRWTGEAFDGIGCVEAFRRRGIGFADKKVMLIGAGGAGAAIGVAVAGQKPAAVRIHDIDQARARALADKVARTEPDIAVVIAPPIAEGVDILLNASPVGMLGDPRMPIEVESLPRDLVVLDAIVKPEKTRLLALAEACGCRTVYGREMMRGQISKIVDFFGFPSAPA